MPDIREKQSFLTEYVLHIQYMLSIKLLRILKKADDTVLKGEELIIEQPCLWCIFE